MKLLGRLHLPTRKTMKRAAAAGSVLAAVGVYYTYLTPQALLQHHLRTIRNAARNEVQKPARGSVAFVGGQSVNELPALHVYAGMSRPYFWFRCACRLALLSVYYVAALVGGIAAYVGIIEFDTFGASLAWALQKLGPLYVKMGQWIATRPDLFPPTIYKHMEGLLEDAPPHGPEATKTAVAAVPELADSLLDFEPNPLSVGSIGQVHLGTLGKPFVDDETGVTLPAGTRLAVKVVHPNARREVAIDSAILCAGAYLTQLAVGGVLNVRAAVDEFRALLLTQLDLRRERDNLIQFRYDFRNSKLIRFPIVLPHFSTEDVLVETFEYGDSVRSITSEFGIAGAGEKGSEPPAASTNPYTASIPATLANMASCGLDAILRMIFEGNFVHADLHAGNCLIRFEQATLDKDGVISTCYASVKDGSILSPEVKRQAELRWGGLESAWLKFHSFFLGSKEGGPDSNTIIAHVTNPQFIVLDAGLSTTLQQKDLDCFVKLFASFTLQDPSVAVQAMEERQLHDDAETSGGPHVEMDKEGFHKAMAEICKRHDPLGKTPVNMSSLFMQLLDAMRLNRVRVEANFASLLSSVIVCEGLGRQMDPKIDVFQQAAPFMVRHFSASQMTAMAGRVAEVNFIKRPLPSLTTAFAASTATPATTTTSTTSDGTLMDNDSNSS